jgi:hypothetical protein
MPPKFEVGDLVSYDWRSVRIGDKAPPNKMGIVVSIKERHIGPLIRVQWFSDSIPGDYEPSSLRIVAKGES